MKDRTLCHGDFRVSRSVFRNGTMQKQSKKAKFPNPKLQDADDPHNKSNVPMIIDDNCIFIARFITGL
jgi:hypothetical protein